VLRKQGFKFDIMSTSFFLSRRSIKASPQSGMPMWQDKLFIKPDQERDGRHELLPDPDRPRRRGRHAGHGLIGKGRRANVPLVQP
jgi:hypothetical protein